jgi:tetratricopeptide (TPR) repeat protein
MTYIFTKRLLAGVCMLALANCDDGINANSNSFRNDYTSARGALEKGQYDKANRIYARMLDNAGPLQPRIQLEYAHSLMRSGDYEGALIQGQSLANTQTDTARSAALSVVAVASHELGQVALNGGDTTTGKQHLITARNALNEVLSNDPDLDPLGALKGRRSKIDRLLRTLA